MTISAFFGGIDIAVCDNRYLNFTLYLANGLILRRTLKAVLATSPVDSERLNATVKPRLMQAQTAAQQLDTIDAYFNDCHRESYDLAC
jgi:hypothetical protein